MTITMRFFSAAFVSCCLLSGGQFAGAREWNNASLQYGRGAHAYFVGQDDLAEKYLSRAIESNPSDPRAYYFRAMSRLRRGQEAEARADMLAGATVEARAPSRYPVGTALERVQGQNRLLLESYRRQARLDEAASRDERARTRYEQTVDREPEILRRPVEVPMEELLDPGKPQQLLEHQVEPAPRENPRSSPANDPFADDPDPSADSGPKPVPKSSGPPAVPPQPGSDQSGPPVEPQQMPADQPVPPQPETLPPQTPSEIDAEDPFGF
jgi:hypothetical protein